MARLTAESVKKMRAPDKRKEVRDSLCPGLVLVLQPTGTKGWQVRYQKAGAQRRVSLGPYGEDDHELDVAAARAKARDLLSKVAAGEDPAPAKEPDRDTVRALVELYDRRHLSTLRTGAAVRRDLDRRFVTKFGDCDIKTVTKRHLLDLLDAISETGHGIAANRTRAYLSGFYSWAVKRDVLEVSPVASIAPPVKERSRDRVLSDDEIRWLWRACERLGEPWGTFAQALLLTGQRRGEVVGMTEAEIDRDLWQLSAERTKNRRPHAVPLSEAALAIVNRPGRIAGPYIFSARGGQISGFAKGLRHLERAMLQEAAKERGEPVVIPRWTFHDLRRTCATNLARLGIPVRVTEAVLNHASGTGGGLVQVYQRYDYRDEARAALQAWSRLVAEIVEGRPANVVRLEATR